MSCGHGVMSDGGFRCQNDGDGKAKVDQLKDRIDHRQTDTSPLVIIDLKMQNYKLFLYYWMCYVYAVPFSCRP